MWCVCFWKPSERPALGQKPRDKCSEVDWLTHLQCCGFMIMGFWILLCTERHPRAENELRIQLLLLHQDIYTHTSVDVVIIKVANLCSKGMCEWVLHYLLNLAWTMLSKFFWLFVHGTILSFLSLGPQKYRNSHKNHWKIEGVTKPQ